MESIQLAQMLADLSDLSAAESQAAVALVSANKTAPAAAGATGEASKPHDHPPVRPGQRHLQRIGSSSSVTSRTGSPARFDKISRKILSPPMSRTNSSQGSIPGTPRRESEGEEDVDRANVLMALYEMRAKLKQQDNTGLMKVREKIAALKDKQNADKKEVADAKPPPRYVYPKTSTPS